MSRQSVHQSLRVHVPHLEQPVRTSRHQEAVVMRHRHGLHLLAVRVRTPATGDQLSAGLSSAQTPDDEVSIAQARDGLVSGQDGRALRVRVQTPEAGLHDVVAGEGHVEYDELGVVVEGVVEARQDVAVVLREVEIADVVVVADGRVVAHLLDGLVAEEVPHHDAGAVAVLVGLAEDDLVAVSHDAESRAVLVFRHLQGLPRREVPDLRNKQTNKQINKHTNTHTNKHTNQSINR